MEFRFKPEGVCAQEMIVEIDGGVIKSAKIVGGCAGNTVGLTNLLARHDRGRSHPQAERDPLRHEAARPARISWRWGWRRFGERLGNIEKVMTTIEKLCKIC